MPRPTKRTPEARAALLRSLRGGATRREAAGDAGIGRNTFYQWLAADRSLRAAVGRAETRAETEAANARLDRSLDRFLGRLLGREQPPPEARRHAVTEEELERLLLRRPWGREWLKVAAGTHEVAYDEWGRRRVWRVPKARNAPGPCGAKTRRGTPCAPGAVPARAGALPPPRGHEHRAEDARGQGRHRREQPEAGGAGLRDAGKQNRADGPGRRRDPMLKQVPSPCRA